jgi:heat shock protein HtpX
MEWPTDWGLRLRMGATMLLLVLLYLLFLGALSVYFRGILPSLVVMVIVMGVQYFFSDRLALRAMGAHEVTAEEYPRLHAQVERLAQTADLPKPTVAVADRRVPNAFAAGRSPGNATVCVTTGLLRRLDEEELAGVLAHEVAHVRNRDVAVMTVATFLSTMAFIVVRWGWLLGGRNRNQAPVYAAVALSLVVWFVSFLLTRALSRYREFAADRGGALLTGDPAGLASALLTIDDAMGAVPEEDLREHAEMNALFVVPVPRGLVTRLVRTHPSTERRVERLREMERDLETTGGRL